MKKYNAGTVFSRYGFRGCLEATRKKTEAVPHQNLSPLDIVLQFIPLIDLTPPESLVRHKGCFANRLNFTGYWSDLGLM